MSLKSKFRKAIDELQSRDGAEASRNGESAARACATFLDQVELASVDAVLAELVRRDVASVHRRIVSNPPALLELDTYQGFMFELLFWYPLPSDISMGGYDTEDVHDHFGYIASRILKGPGYTERSFVQHREANSVQLVNEWEFSIGTARIIKPDTVHSVLYPHEKPSVSTRIVLPPIKGIMTVYDPLSLQFKESIVCASERKSYELAGMLSLVCSDNEELAELVGNVRESVILPETKVRVTDFGSNSR